MEQDVTRLASAVDAVRSVRPDHARLAFFVSQLERERAIQGKTGQPVRAVDTLGRPIESPAAEHELPSVRVQAFVQLANERMRSNQLIGKDSAHRLPALRPPDRARGPRPSWRRVGALGVQSPEQRAEGDPREPPRRSEPLDAERASSST